MSVGNTLPRMPVSPREGEAIDTGSGYVVCKAMGFSFLGGDAMDLYGTMRIGEGGRLEVGGCDTIELAKEFGTPLYIFDEECFRERCALYRDSFEAQGLPFDVAYSGKAFMTYRICNILKEEGLALEVVSGGELYLALKAGFPPDEVYFTGNYKNADELELAIEVGIKRIVVDNSLELDMLSNMLKGGRRKVDILLRVVPGIEAHTHEYIRTGQVDTKFGFDIDCGDAMKAVRSASKSRSLRLRGIHAHIGSQVLELEPYRLTVRRLVEFMCEVREEVGVELEELDMGGGLGIRYTRDDKPPSIPDLVATITDELRASCDRYGLHLPKIIVEPGRSIVGEAGHTAYTVGPIKDIPGIRTYVAVDGGMGDNPRPALYGAAYNAIVANKVLARPVRKYTVAGRYCESGDILIHEIELPEVEPGDTLVVFCTGAYNYSMASNYNKVPRAAAVTVRDGKAELMLRRESYDDLLNCEVVTEGRTWNGKRVVAEL